VHFQGRPQQRKELEIWLRGWSLALAEMNHMRTGIRTESLLDIHFAGGDKIVDKSSAAAKVNLPEEALKELPLKNKIAK
jgi:pyruvate,water dikinase